jgi:hypothetical protein
MMPLDPDEGAEVPGLSLEAVSAYGPPPMTSPGKIEWQVFRRLLLGLVVCSGCGSPPPPATVESAVATVSSTASGQPSELPSPAAASPLRCPKFHDVHREARLEHVYRNGERGQCLLMETTGGGAGWLDYDADGSWDLYLNQGGDPTAEPDARQPTDRIFRNRGDGTFEDVTAQARIAEFRYSQGVCVGDYDDDGFDDVYVTSINGNTLFHNQGDGTFLEVTEAAGVRDGRWSTSAAFADLDQDGDLDLYVVNYCIYDAKHPKPCPSSTGEPRICHPASVEAWPDECYFNQGDGTFQPESGRRGLLGEDGRGLGVAVADLNNDGLPDVYVTNDTTSNFYFVNRGRGQFEEQALLAGCAVDASGNPQASMGATVYDFDQDGQLDLYVGHFEMEYNTLYHNYGPAGFQDETAMYGLAAPTLERLTFGTLMNDFDQDGRTDIVTSCGHIENHPGFERYRMLPQAFTFDGTRWRECSLEVGEFFRRKHVGRAIAACDYDEDGDLDLVVAQENDPAALLRNDSQRGHWLKFLMRGSASNRRGIGCRITVEAGTKRYLQELCGGAAYGGTHQPALVFGLGDWGGACRVSIRWPGGMRQTIESLSVDQGVLLRESDARPEPGKTLSPDKG